MRSRVQTLVKYYYLDVLTEGNRYVKALQKNRYTQIELRQLSNALGVKELSNVIFWILLWERQFSKQFLMQMFGNCDESIKKEIDETVSELLSQIMEDLDPKGSDFKYVQNILDDVVALNNIRNYIVYCNPLELELIQHYNFYPQNLNIALRNILDVAKDIQFIRGEK